jgi:hypothetical protein
MMFGRKNRSRIVRFVSKPMWLSFGDGSKQIRLWLDGRQITPVSFKLAPEGRIGFEISFRSETDAEAFGEFWWNMF